MTILDWTYDIQTAWLAGVIDTDGTMGFNFQSGSAQPRIDIGNKSSALLEELHLMYLSHIQKSKGRVNVVTFKPRLTEEILNRTLPYLIVKQDRAEILLKFLQSRKLRKGGSYTADEVSWIRQYYDIMKVLQPNMKRSRIEAILKSQKNSPRREGPYDRLKLLEVGKLYTTHEVNSLMPNFAYITVYQSLNRLAEKGLVRKIGSGHGKEVKWVCESELVDKIHIPKSQGVLGMTSDMQAAWLAAIIDCDGHIGFSFPSKGSASIKVGITNNSRTFLEEINKQFPGQIYPAGSSLVTHFPKPEVSQMLRCSMGTLRFHSDP